MRNKGKIIVKSCIRRPLLDAEVVQTEAGLLGGEGVAGAQVLMSACAQVNV